MKISFAQLLVLVKCDSNCSQGGALKSPWKKLALTLSVLAMPFILSGCVSTLVRDKIYDHSDFYKTIHPELSDEIVSFGFADAPQNEAREQKKTLVLLGRKNAYTIDSGAMAIDQIARSGLDINLLQTDADVSHTLFIKGDRFWGRLKIGYKIASPSFNVPPALEKLGFQPAEDTVSHQYHFVKSVTIGGTIHSADKALSAPYARLDVPQAFNLYDPDKANPPANWGSVALFPGAIVADAVLGLAELIGYFLVAVLGA